MRFVRQLGALTLRLRFAMIGAAIATPLILPCSIVTAAADTVFVGEQFKLTALEIAPNSGDLFIGTVTIGTPTSGGFFTVADMSVIRGAPGVLECLSCGLVSEDLSNLFFNSATFGLSGTVTGEYVGDSGNHHTLSSNRR